MRLTKKEIAELERLTKKWRKKFAARKAAIKASANITAKDLALRVK
jgi:hypothetical protein